MFKSLRVARTLSALFLAIFFMFIGDALALSSAGVILKMRGQSDLIIGIISSFFFLGAISSVFFTPTIIGRFAHVRSYYIFSTIFALCALAHDISANLAFWAILRFGLGFCYYALLMIIESWINSKITNSIRSRVLAVYEIVFYGAFTVGVGIIALNLSANLIFFLSGFFILFGLVPLKFMRFNPPAKVQKATICMPKISVLPPLALATAVCGGVLINGFFSMASVYVLSSGNVSQVGWFMGLAMVGGFISQIFASPVSDFFGRRKAIMLVCAIGACSALGLFATGNFEVKCALAFLLGFGVFPLYSLAIARANDSFTNSSSISRVQISASLLFSYSLSSFFSPIIIGGAMRVFGAEGFSAVFFVAMVFLLVFAYFRPEIAPKI
ncbi:MAG: MFS transporter [Campylobacter sp.]|nr:MFS transporter [Campylobacter sp.]